MDSNMTTMSFWRSINSFSKSIWLESCEWEEIRNEIRLELMNWMTEELCCTQWNKEDYGWFCWCGSIPETTSSAYAQRHAESQPLHPISDCGLDSADSLCMGPLVERIKMGHLFSQKTYNSGHMIINLISTEEYVPVYTQSVCWRLALLHWWLWRNCVVPVHQWLLSQNNTNRNHWWTPTGQNKELLLNDVFKTKTRKQLLNINKNNNNNDKKLAWTLRR